MGRNLQLGMMLSQSWQVMSTALIVAGFVALLLFSRLGNMLPGYSQTELRTAASARNISSIVHNPVNAPYKILALAYSHITHDPLLSTRLAAATFGVGTLALFYVGVRHWYRKRIAFLATVLFACSAWFLHIARFGAPDIMLPFSMLLLAVSGYWLATGKHSALSMMTLIFALALSIYIPGLIWLLIPAAIIRRRDIWRVIRTDLSWKQGLVLLLLLGATVAAPIAYAFSQNTELIRVFLGIPTPIPPAMGVLQNIVALPIKIFIWSPGNTELYLGHLPYVDIFTTIMFVLGLYYYVRHRTSLARTKLLGIFFVLVAILIALDDETLRASILLPAVYIVATAGIAMLWRQWITIFPKNPVAKSFGIAMITIAVLASCAYNLRAYYVAWVHNAQTRSVYQLSNKNLLQ